MGFVEINPEAFEEYAKDVSDNAKAKVIYEKMGGTMSLLSAELLQNAKDRTPVKTGQLRASWHTTGMTYSSNAFSFEIYNNTKYAPFVEYGHRTPNHKGWVNGQHMLKAVVDDYKSDFNDYWKPKFNDALKDVIEK